MNIFNKDLKELKTSKIAGGRIGIYLPEHPKANGSGYVLRYRFVMEKKLGRFLNFNELVHHKNENKLDDREENLEIKNRSEHTIYHNRKERKLDYSKIKELRNKGFGHKRIAKILGYPRQSVWSAIKRVLEPV